MASTSTTTADSIYLAMREKIVMAELMPGERLVHRQLAKEFGSSNIPVLEALRRLESEGLVISHPNAGAHVKRWDEDDIEGTFLAREALEGVACRLFVERASAREKKRLPELGLDIDNACRMRDLEALCQADIAFHLYIAGDYNAAARTSTLFRLVSNSCVLTATIGAICIDGVVEENPFGPVGGHDRLIAALSGDDPDLAEWEGKAHVREVLEILSQMLAKRKDRAVP